MATEYLVSKIDEMVNKVDNYEVTRLVKYVLYYNSTFFYNAVQIAS
jgi:hypothetical protein